MRSGRKSTPVKTSRGVANIPPQSEEALRTPLPDVLGDPMMFLPEVERATRLSATTIWRREAVGEFPPRHRHGKYAVWFRSEIIAYLELLRANAAGPAPAPVRANEARRQAARRRREAA